MPNKNSQPERKVQIDNIESMSIMGLILKTILEKNISKTKKYNRVKNLNAIYNIGAGKMKVNVSFNNGEITVATGYAPEAVACVEGTLAAFVKIGAGGQFITPFLTRKLKVSGQITSLLPLLAVMRV